MKFVSLIISIIIKVKVRYIGKIGTEVFGAIWNICLEKNGKKIGYRN